ncbi:unnamed protein product [Litomosoides sigmodontis]|uniref:RRM domain-containing protein n=1 Tax=Litomosoides sigmodontis TaxID=42156 RepID=A0A3P6V4H4_LITSI|nr:unnamed protein product [Litomosoides sigmodontis]
MATRLVRRSALKTFKGAWRKSAELFVKRISWVTGASELSNHFSQFGKVRSIMLPFDLRTGLHKGFAFISFENNDFYENIKKFEGKHVIDDEEVVCSLANEGKPLLSSDADLTLFGSGNTEMDTSRANCRNGVGADEFIRTEENFKGKEVKHDANPKRISTSGIDSQDSKEWWNESNLLQKMQKTDNRKEISGKNSLLEKTAVAELTNLVRENGGNDEVHRKTYTNVRHSNGFYENVTSNSFSGRVSSSNRSFRIRTFETTKQKHFKKETDSGRV